MIISIRRKKDFRFDGFFFCENFVIFVIAMSTSRIFHSVHLDISTSEANRICYIILPERLKESEKPWLDRMAETLSANMVVISDLDWDSDLTPWRAPGLKTGEFAGKAQAFLEILSNDIIVNIESSLRISRPERYICGVSLSGLFALWASCKKDIFKGVAAVSGSFWYDGFVEWFKEQELKTDRYFLSLGDKEVKAKNERLASVGSCTEAILQIIQDKSKEVTFLTDDGNHFEFFKERLEKAIQVTMPAK